MSIKNLKNRRIKTHVFPIIFNRGKKTSTMKEQDEKTGVSKRLFFLFLLIEEVKKPLRWKSRMKKQVYQNACFSYSY